MAHIPYLIYLLPLLFAPSPALANECWSVSNIEGYSAYADGSYEFVQDASPNTLLLCFTPEDGTVTGTNVRFGRSTLAGYGGNDRGNEFFEVYQIDRANEKLLYTRTRIGTKTVAPPLSDIVSSFVGDATKVSQ